MQLVQFHLLAAKMPHEILQLFFFSILLKCVASQNPKFTILSQRLVQPGSTYNVSVFTEIGSVATKFQITISTSAENYTSDKVEILGGQTAFTGVQLPQNMTVNLYYNLSITAEAPSAGYVYSEWNYIYPEKQSLAPPFLTLETDKPIYKPGETVRFRVILLNGNLLPLGDITNTDDTAIKPKIVVNMKILDSQGTLVKMWEEEFTKGLVSSSLFLSSQPNLGEWTLMASVEGIDVGSASLAFNVDTYTLPAFKVNLKVPPYATFNDSKINVEIQGAYTYGKRVQGNCTVSVYRCLAPGTTWAYCWTWPTIQRKVSLDPNGKALVDLDPSAPSLFSFWDKTSQQDLKVEAICWDNILNRPQNSSAVVNIYPNPFRIELLKQSSAMKPGFPVTFTFKISTPDGRPIVPKKSDVAIVRLESAACIAFSIENTKAIKIPASGTFSFSLDIPAQYNGGSMPINVTYNGMSRVFYPTFVNDYYNPQLRLTRADPDGDDSTSTAEPGKPISFNAATSKGVSFTRLHYILTARGRIVGSGSLQPDNATTDYTFQITLPLISAKSMNLTVFILSWNSGMPYMTDSLEILLTSSAANSLKISMSKATVKPKGSVKISFSTDSDSLVALKGIDQSVLLLKSDADLRRSVNAKLDAYNKQLVSMSTSTLVPGIESLGVVVFSSCDYFRYNYRYYRQYYPPSGRSMVLEMAVSGSILGKPAERSDFPETWLWEEIPPNTFDIVRTVPDTLTSWIVTGYSLNTETGIGFSSPTSLTVFMPFFASINLPFAVVQGEAFYLQILVHNYLGASSDAGEAVVTLDNSEGQFQFLEPKLVNQTKGVKKIMVSNDQVRLVAFLVKAIKFGSVRVKVSASNGQAGDSILQTLQVKPQGSLQSRSQTFLVDLRKDNKTSFNVSVDFPPARISGTETLKVMVTGDLLGSAVINLKSLIQMPCGCGEQNMIYLVPDIVVLVYLNSTGWLTPDLEATLISYIQYGYQNQLNYKLADGSFAVFPSYPGSTWLTSYVIRSFLAASPFITVDPNVIESGLQFLANRSASDGRFFENGTTFHTEMMGGVRGNPLALTAYVLLTFLESGIQTNASYGPTVTKSLDYIGHLNNTNSSDVYIVNLIAYTLQLADHANKDAFLNAMLKRAKRPTADIMYWDQNNYQIPTSSIYPPTPLSVESTGYALMTLLLSNRIEEAIFVAKWLTKQRNGQGGFLSTQDTVVGLTALAMLARRLQNNKMMGMTVDFNYNSATERFQISGKNSRVLQETYSKMSNSTQIDIVAVGKGMALAQVSWSYYLKVNFASPAFSISVKVSHNLNSSDSLNLHVCTSFLKGNSSNMAVMEVNLPSGFVFDTLSSDLPTKQPKISRVDKLNGNTKLDLYFSVLTPNEICMDLPVIRSFDVANTAPAFIQIYDYYNIAFRALEYYDVPQLSVCDICNDDKDCESFSCKK